MKRVLACLLSCLFLLPMSLLPMAVSAADSERIVAEIDHKVSSNMVIGDNKILINQGSPFVEDPIDISDYPRANLALEFDLYLKGDVDLIPRASGQIELSSGGKNDVEEINYNTKNLTYQAGWTRYTLPLSSFSGNETDYSNINFFRMYVVSLPDEAIGKRYTVKLCNVRIVDTTKGEATDPVGDGSIEPKAPEWELAPTKYETDDLPVIGYNLRDYLPTYESDPDQDVTMVIQSLMDALNEAGGGTLFIPEGEYVCRGELLIPYGVTLRGDWTAPDGQSAPKGTILKVYSGKGSTEDKKAFIRMQSNTMVRDMTFWYPEQSYTSFQQYPPTILQYDANTWGDDYEHVRNVTLINSYIGIKQGPASNGCPTIYNVYGTPLFYGLNMDGIADVGRFEQIHFSPDYWANSGLAGAPSNEEQRATLKERLRENGTGVVLQRIDWSYLMYSEIEGYNMGLYMAHSKGDGGYPNGQTYGLEIRDCVAGILVDGVSRASEVISNVQIENCDTGIMILRTEDCKDGNILFYDTTIDAVDTAISYDGYIKMLFSGGKIDGGQIYTSNGTLTVMDCDINTDGTQILLDRGTNGAVLLGNRFKNTAVIENAGHCPLERSDDPVDTGDAPEVPASETKSELTRPKAEKLYVADVDVSGETDVTAALQALLDEAGKTGGIVFLKPGCYRLDGQLVIPTGVELKGAVDIGRNPYNIGTVLEIYGGAGQPDGPAAIQMKAGSGIRGIVFEYPEQYKDSFTDINAVVAYPYAIQGQGADIYIINVAMRNGYNGVDLMSYRCDNHYVEYLSGVALGTMIRVGGGSTGGLVANYQLNYTTLLNGAQTKYGSWENAPSEEERQAFEQMMYKWMQERSIVMQVGDVTDQRLYNNFSYSGGRGIQFIEENGKAASGWCLGHAIDFATIAIEVQALEEMPFVNLQLTAFDKLSGDIKLESEDGVHAVYLTEEFDGEVNIHNLTIWAKPDSYLNVQGGTLNVYGGNYHARAVVLATAGEKGKMNLLGGFIDNQGIKALASEHLDRIFVTGYTLLGAITTEGAGRWEHNMVRVTRWDVPADADIGLDEELLFTEDFNGYEVKETNGIANALVATNEFRQISKPSADGNLTLAEVDGVSAVRFYQNNKSSAVYLGNNTLFLQPGDIYRFESRIKLDRLCAAEDSMMALYLYSTEGRSVVDLMTVVRFLRDGNAVMAGDTKIGTWVADTWYRVEVKVDARSGADKKYCVCLYDDTYEVVAESGWLRMGEGFQYAERGIGNMMWELTASTQEAETSGEVWLDYLVVTKPAAGSSSAVLGDIDGNGVVNTTDARLALQYAVEKITLTEAQLAAGDVDGDGVVNTTDARLILQYAVEKIDKFPAGK